jgi:hypothetical protein
MIGPFEAQWRGYITASGYRHRQAFPRYVAMIIWPFGGLKNGRCGRKRPENFDVRRLNNSSHRALSISGTYTSLRFEPWTKIGFKENFTFQWIATRECVFSSPTDHHSHSRICWTCPHPPPLPQTIFSHQGGVRNCGHPALFIFIKFHHRPLFSSPIWVNKNNVICLV